MNVLVFGSVDSWAVFLAAVAAAALGAVWYRVLATPWMAATGMTDEMMKGDASGTRAALPYVLAFIAYLVIALALYGVIWHVGGGHFATRSGVISGVLCWLGFIIPTMTVNGTFARRRPILLGIDGGYWLLALAAMGAVIGAMGPA
jgi:hypothetical protein